MLFRNAAHLDNVLDTLDPQLHSLGVLAILCVKFLILNQNGAQTQGVAIPDYEVLVGQVTQFINICNGEQIRCAPDSCQFVFFLLHFKYFRKISNICFLFLVVADLCHVFAVSMVERQTPARGIAPLIKAVRKIRLNETQLTSVHADLLQLCLMSKNLKPAIEFLQVDITDINSEVGTNF